MIIYLCVVQALVLVNNNHLHMNKKKQHDRGSDSRRDEPIKQHKPMGKKQNDRTSDSGRGEPIKLLHASTTDIQLTVEQKAEQEAIQQILDDAKQKNAEFNKSKLVYILHP